MKWIAALLFTLFSIWWGLFLASPPSPKPVNSPETEFSAHRAFRHVEAIAQKPHMTGTEENDRVRSYIASQLRELELDPRVEEGISATGYDGHYVAAQTKNITARMNGAANPNQTIMLMAHYDSVPYAPGAGDDASGVAAILETLRAVKAGNPLKNDLLILFTDGEELGLLGARQFAGSFQHLDEIDLIFNMESRGSGGASIMFETNTGNSGLIPHFAKSTPYPVANSLTHTIYKLLPNDTDFSVFKPFGMQGLNFAFIENYLNYHTMQDIPSNLSLPSLQHHGENLLANVRYFGNIHFEMEADPGSDLLYFNNPFGGLTYYPETWSGYFTGLTVILFLFTLYAAYKNRWITPGKSLIGTVSFLGILVAGTLLTHFGWQLIESFFSQYQWQSHGETYARKWYFWLFISLVTLLFSGICSLIQTSLNINNLLFGMYLILIILLITLTVLLPAVSYLLLWPVFFGLAGWLLTGEGITGHLDWRALAILFTGLFMTLFMMPFYIKLIHVALTSQMPAAYMFLFILMLGLLWPLLHILVQPLNNYWYLISGIAIIICIAGAISDSGFDETQKKQNSLIYAADLDNGSYYWLSRDHKTDEWTSRFLGPSPGDSVFNDFGVFGTRSLLYATASPVAVRPPDISIVEDHTENSLRSLIIRIEGPGAAHGIQLSLNNPVTEAAISGTSLFDIQAAGNRPEAFSRLSYYADLNQPFTLSLVVKQDASNPALAVRMVAFNNRLPGGLMQAHSGRKSYMMPRPSRFANGTVWKKTFIIDRMGMSE